jgi:hypothetical protein
MLRDPVSPFGMKKWERDPSPLLGMTKAESPALERIGIKPPAFGTTPFPLSYVCHNEKRKSPNSFESGLFGI